MRAFAATKESRGALDRAALAALAIAASVLAAPASRAVASGSTQPSGRVYYDQRGFPRCVASASDGSDGVLLLWDTSLRYPRPIYVASLADVRFTLHRQQVYPLGCQQWPSYYELATEDVANWTSYYDEIPAASREAVTRFGRYAIPAEALERLAQARKGASYYYGSLTPAEWLRRNPIAEFSRTDNRRISAEFGVGFAADVYKLWTESLPSNREMKAAIRGYVARAQSGSLARQTSERFAGYKILVAEGYMQTPKKNRLQTFYRALSAMRIEHQAMRFDPIGSLQENASSFEAQIEAALQSSRKRIILAAASKGVPELLTALANLNSRNPALASRTAGVLNMAGMFEGSYLVDWAGSGIQSLLVGRALKTGAEAAGLEMTRLDGFHAMSTTSLARAALAYSSKLPKVLYFNFVGVLSGDGLSRDPEIGMLQKSLAIPRLGSSSGGNDGYIEYPGTMMPRSWGLHSTEIVFDSSHAIVDGFYDGRDLKSDVQRRLVFDGIFQAIADRLEGARR